MVVRVWSASPRAALPGKVDRRRGHRCLLLHGAHQLVCGSTVDVRHPQRPLDDPEHGSTNATGEPDVLPVQGPAYAIAWLATSLTHTLCAVCESITVRCRRRGLVGASDGMVVWLGQPAEEVSVRIRGVTDWQSTAATSMQPLCYTTHVGDTPPYWIRDSDRAR